MRPAKVISSVLAWVRPGRKRSKGIGHQSTGQSDGLSQPPQGLRRPMVLFHWWHDDSRLRLPTSPTITVIMACVIHLLRELAFVIESNGYRWARNIKRLLGETCAEVSAPEEKQLTDQELANLHQGYRHILLVV